MGALSNNTAPSADTSNVDALRIADRLFAGVRGFLGAADQTPITEDGSLNSPTGGYTAGYAAPIYDNWGNVIRQSSQATPAPGARVNLLTIALIAGGIYLLLKKG